MNCETKATGVSEERGVEVEGVGFVRRGDCDVGVAVGGAVRGVVEGPQCLTLVECVSLGNFWKLSRLFQLLRRPIGLWYEQVLACDWFPGNGEQQIITVVNLPWLDADMTIDQNSEYNGRRRFGLNFGVPY